MKTPEELARKWKDEYLENPPEVTEPGGHLITAFLAGYAVANRWISVEEELPEIGGVYLVCFNGFDSGEDISTSLWVKQENHAFWANLILSLRITHWQPLPPSPTK